MCGYFTFNIFPNQFSAPGSFLISQKTYSSFLPEDKNVHVKLVEYVEQLHTKF